MLASIMREGRKTTALVSAEEGAVTDVGGILGKGEARCRPEDHMDRAIGDGIAVARAIRDFGAQAEAYFAALSITEAQAAANGVHRHPLIIALPAIP